MNWLPNGNFDESARDILKELEEESGSNEDRQANFKNETLNLNGPYFHVKLHLSSLTDANTHDGLDLSTEWSAKLLSLGCGASQQTRGSKMQINTQKSLGAISQLTLKEILRARGSQNYILWYKQRTAELQMQFFNFVNLLQGGVKFT